MKSKDHDKRLEDKLNVQLEILDRVYHVDNPEKTLIEVKLAIYQLFQQLDTIKRSTNNDLK